MGMLMIVLDATILNVASAGLAFFARVPVDGSYVVDALPVMVLLGLGAGLAFPSLVMLAMSGATSSDSGLASGLVNTTLQVGGAIGLAVLATLATTRTDNLLAQGESTASALTGGYHLAFLIGALLVIAAIGVALGVLRSAGAVEEDPFEVEPAVASNRSPKAAGAGLAAALSAVALFSCGPLDELTGTKVDTVGQVGFENRLAIPPLADSELDSEGRRVFKLTAEAGEREFRRGASTETWGFNGSYLGPTLRASRGEEVVVDVRNRLDEATSVHWHGMHLPANADGGPHQVVEPGGSWTPSWEIDQPAATLWYHPHPHGDTEKHVYRGLAGMFILDDAEEAELDLPREYGVDDVPVIVQDKRFAEDGSLIEDDRERLGILGDTLLVNGTYGPYLDVSTERVRLRLLNGSTARTYDFGFSDERDFALIATDGGLLERPAEMDRIQLSPGERAEIVVTIEPRERVVLRSNPPDLDPGSDTSRKDGGEDSFDVMQLRAAAELERSAPLPAELVDTPKLDPADAVETREFELRSRRINGEEMDMDRIDTVVSKGTTEVWDVENGHGQPHTFHVHDVQFQVLDVDGENPPPELSGWKDTIQLPPRVQVGLVMAFEDYADSSSPYMYHCHLLRHEDEGMMGQFVVIEPGEDAGETPAHGEPGHDHAEDHG